MLTKVQIIDGYGAIEREGQHIKIISADTTVKLVARDKGGKVIASTPIRQTMALDLGETAARVEFEGENQIIEVWYSKFPLDYQQFLAVGATRIKAGAVTVAGGARQVVAANAARKAVTVEVTGGDVFFGDQGQLGAGWRVGAGQKETFEIMGELWAYKPAPIVDLSLASALVIPNTFAGAVKNWNSYIHFNGRSIWTGDLSETGSSVLDDGSDGKSIGSGGLTIYGEKAWHVANGAAYSSVDGKTFLLTFGAGASTPCAGQVTSRQRGKFSTRVDQRSGRFHAGDFDAAAMELIAVPALLNGAYDTVNCDAGVFVHRSGEGSDRGLYKRQPDGSFAQCYVSNAGATSMKFVTADAESGGLIAIINGYFCTSDDGVTFTQVPAASVSWTVSTSRYIYAGAHIFIQMDGAATAIAKNPAELGGGVTKTTKTLWSGTNRILGYCVDGDKVWGGTYQNAQKEVAYFSMDGVAQSVPATVRALEVLF